MNFYFEKLVLWSQQRTKRELVFLPNKVNVITGGSNTGKSAILQIIDYCFFGSHSKISESRINENVSWYGINFRINDKHYTICRASLDMGGKVSDSYYFSSSGELPEFPTANCKANIIKSLIETEFGINRNVTMPFGGTFLSPGSKISLRYLLLFTTISGDIITSSSIYFDKQNEDRYREALPRIFDLAVGIDNIENILAKEKKSDLETKIKKIERMQNRSSLKKDDFHGNRIEIVKKAKEFGLINPNADAAASMEILSSIIAENVSSNLVDEKSTEYSQLKSLEYEYNRTVRNLKNVKDEYKRYKDALTGVEDSVKPIVYLNEKKSEIIKTSIYHDIVTALEADFISLKKDIKTKTPVDANVIDLINEYESKLVAVRNKLAELPQNISGFKSDKDKYLFIGEMKAKIELYGEQDQSILADYVTDLRDLQDKLLSIIVKDSTESRIMFVKLLEEIVQEYICVAGNVLQNYEKYHPVFDYTNKALLLRKPLTDYIENIGSSSNHMFMHLFLFCGLHEAIQIKKAPFVPSYLIIDQPSRPYWGDPDAPKQKLDHSDEAKIGKVFELLNLFIDRIVSKPNGQCQLIVLEHVPPSTWAGLKNVHLVEEFNGGNALIPESWIQSE